MKKRWLFIPVVVGLLALAVTSGAIFAQSGGKDEAFSSKTMAARVAENLNEALGLTLQESDVQAAFHQSLKERQEEVLQGRLDRRGVDAEEASAIMTWFRNWPNDSPMGMRPRIAFSSSERVDRVLGHLVDRERITQDEADDIKAWHDDRPELPEGFQGRGGRGHSFREGPSRGDNGANDTRAFRGAPQTLSAPATTPTVFY